MNYTNSFIFRALSSILVGLLLALNPERMTVALVLVIGILFALSGCFSLINYWIAVKSKDVTYKPAFPIVGLGSFLFGVFMSSFPDLFIKYLMFVLGIFVILAGANQIFTFVKFRKMIYTPWYLYVFSLMVLGMGLLILLKPMETASLPFLILGYTSIFYGIAELVNGVRIKRAQKQMLKSQSNDETA